MTNCVRDPGDFTFSAVSTSGTQAGVVVEIASRGYATYLFATPRKLEEFLARYARTSKEDIRTK